MPTKTDRAKVEVKESSSVDVRSFIITLTVPVSDFQLADLLKQRGVIGGLDIELKQAIKQATENYLKSAESLIASLASQESTNKKHRSNSKGDDKSSESDSLIL